MQNLVGKTLGKYRIVARLGSGGMAEVYKAFQPSLDRYVAIKMMHAHLGTDPDFVKRFQREALATGRLMHPNIVQALDFDEDAGIYYMVMQFINGPTLRTEFRERLRQRRGFLLEEITRIYLALGDALDYAHNRGMIHRDLKPPNLMLNEEGQVLITDFGIARLLGGTQYTATGAMTGTPAYMSPEQGRGDNVDGRSDIYALGVILYELVTGKVPYEADTPIAIVMKHITTPVPLPSKINPRVPPAVEEIILKAMAKAPQDRFPSAGALAQTLREAVGLKPGDNLRRQPLKPVAPPPKIDNELDPTTGSFTPVNLTTLAHAPEATVSPQQAELTEVQTLGPRPRSGSFSALIGGVILMLLILGGGFGYFRLRTTSTPRVEPASPTATATATLDALQTAEMIAQLDQAGVTATVAWLEADSDRDGLANAEEVALGSLPDKRDTDQDNIDDGDEVNLHKTNPLRSDSDGDGLKDGLEISQGLNPLSQDTDGDGLSDAKDPSPASTPTPTATATPPDTATPVPTDTPLPTNTPMPGPTAPPTVTPTPLPTSTPTTPAATPTPPDPTEQRVVELIAQASPMSADKTGLLVVNCHETDTIDWYVESPRSEHRLVAKIPPAKDGICGISHVEGFFIVHNYDFGFIAKWMGTRRYLFTNLPPAEIGAIYFRDGEAELRGLEANFQYCPSCR